MADQASYLRAAFIAYEPDGFPEKKRVIPFRFNPESLSRQLSVEQGTAPAGPQTADASAGTAAAEQSADSSSGTTKHAFTVLIRFDLADRVGDGAQNLPLELGVAPEIAALEDLLYPGESESEAASDGTEAVHAHPRRPTVLFVWGRQRVYPVKIVSMTINETIFNAELNPIRVEIEVSLEVLGDSEVRNNPAVGKSLSFTTANRRALSRLFLANTVAQGSNILRL
jgi:hypothetical protein